MKIQICKVTIFTGELENEIGKISRFFTNGRKVENLVKMSSKQSQPHNKQRIPATLLQPLATVQAEALSDNTWIW